MLYQNTIDSIKGKQEAFLSFKRFSDKDLIDLVELMNKNDSIVNSLSFDESNLTALGIQTLIEKYGHKLVALNLENNDLNDTDVAPILKHKELCANSVFRRLNVRNNCLTSQMIESLNKIGLEHLEVGSQAIINTEIPTLAKYSHDPIVFSTAVKNQPPLIVDHLRRPISPT